MVQRSGLTISLIALFLGACSNPPDGAAVTAPDPVTPTVEQPVEPGAQAAERREAPVVPANVVDAGAPDAVAADAGASDGGATDTGAPDAPDAPDAGEPDPGEPTIECTYTRRNYYTQAVISTLVEPNVKIQKTSLIVYGRPMIRLLSEGVKRAMGENVYLDLRTSGSPSDPPGKTYTYVGTIRYSPEGGGQDTSVIARVTDDTVTLTAFTARTRPYLSYTDTVSCTPATTTLLAP